MARSFGKAGLSIFLYLLLETLIFIGLSSWIGFGWALALSLGTTILGWLIRPKLWKGCLDSLGKGQACNIASCYGPSQWQRMSASFLLILPGILTDAIGLLVLLPPVWNGLVAAIGTRFLHFLSRQAKQPMGRHPTTGQNTRKAMGMGQNSNRQKPIDIGVTVINIKTTTQTVNTQKNTRQPQVTSKNQDCDIIEVDHEWLS